MKSRPLASLGVVAETGNAEIDRLLKEKNDLMGTGCYTNDDPLIIEIDRQIRAS